MKQGFLIVPFGRKSDVSVIRACAVTCGASQTTREMIRQAKRLGAYVVVIGCLENKGLPEINFIAKNNEEAAENVLSLRTQQGGHMKSLDSASGFTRDDKRTRVLIKIQTGCAFSCAYCVIPSYRGKPQSVPAEKIIKKIKEAETEGYKEIVLTGINICLYKDNRLNLAGLIQKILKETKIPRIRLGSLDPRLITDELISLYSNIRHLTFDFRLLPHWHLSLQSGSDKILKLMNRNYTTKKYLSVVKKLRKANPLFSFTTDIIVGFPGETEKDFEETCEFVKKAEFAKVHIFPYSPRPNTSAAKMPGQVSDKIKKERARKLKTVADAAAKTFAAKFIGQIRPVLFEHKKTDAWPGFTPEYLEIKHKSKENLWNRVVNIKIKKENIS